MPDHADAPGAVWLWKHEEVVVGYIHIQDSKWVRFIITPPRSSLELPQAAVVNNPTFDDRPRWTRLT